MVYLVVISFRFWMSSDLAPIKKDYESLWFLLSHVPPEHSTTTSLDILYVDEVISAKSSYLKVILCHVHSLNFREKRSACFQCRTCGSMKITAKKYFYVQFFLISEMGFLCLKVHWFFPLLFQVRVVLRWRRIWSIGGMQLKGDNLSQHNSSTTNLAWTGPGSNSGFCDKQLIFWDMEQPVVLRR
jgi:hypothetical protein